MVQLCDEIFIAIQNGVDKIWKEANWNVNSHCLWVVNLSLHFNIFPQVCYNKTYKKWQEKNRFTLTSILLLAISQKPLCLGRYYQEFLASGEVAKGRLASYLKTADYLQEFSFISPSPAINKLLTLENW